MNTDAVLRALVDEAPGLERASLTARVEWLQRLVDALAGAGEASDGRTQAVLTDLRAAIGAVVAWGRGPRTPQSLHELELVMRALIARGTAGLYELLARDLRAMAAHDVDAAACLTAADAAHAAAEAVARGESVAAAHVDALAALRARRDDGGTNGPPRL